MDVQAQAFVLTNTNRAVISTGCHANHAILIVFVVLCTFCMTY